MPCLTPVQRHLKLMAFAAKAGDYKEWLAARARLKEFYKEEHQTAQLPADVRKELRRHYKMLIAGDSTWPK